MNKLRQLAGNPDFISGIYNYCDRWCERCAFTSRCLVYRSIEADSECEDLETHDLNNARFWERMAATFAETKTMIKEWADELGVDLSTIEGQDREDEVSDASNHELVLAAKGYALKVFSWFGPVIGEKESDLERVTGSDDDEIAIDDAVDVIRHYQFFISAKIFRALIASESYPIDDASKVPAGDEDSDFTNDPNGSAKIALIAIERSIFAWHVLRDRLPQHRESIQQMISELEAIKAAVEKQFPHAHDFLRPGFDILDSPFTN